MMGFTEKQKASLEKALSYCEIPENMILGTKKLIDSGECVWTDCSIVCDCVFKIAYGERGLFSNHEAQNIAKNNATAELSDLLTRYNLL